MASGRDVPMEALLGQRDWLRRLARHLAGQASDGDDLAQEAWLAAHRSPPDPGRPPRPWLAQVLRNLIHSRRRDDLRRARRERDYQDSGPQRAAAVDEVYDRVELQRFVVEQVMALDEPLRIVVILRYFEDLDSGRVAQLTGTPAGTVRWRLKQALDRLRAALDARHGGDRAAWVVVLAPGAAAEIAPKAAAPTRSPAARPPLPPARRTPHTGGIWVMASTKTKALLVSLAGIGLLALSAGALWWTARDRGRAGASALAAATRGGGRADRLAPASATGGAAAPPRLLIDPEAVPGEQTAAGCAGALVQAREEADALDREARELIPALAFDAGAPNRALRAQVLPQIERRWPAAAAGLGVSYQVECRSWACGIAVRIPVEESPEVEPRLRAMGVWLPAVNRLEELQMHPPSPLGVAVQWVGSRPVKERLNGKKLEEYTFFFGAPPGASAPVEHAPEAAAVAAPESLDACRREIAAARARQRPRLAQLEGFRPLATLFTAGAGSPELTDRVQAAADRAGASARVACRAGICRLRFDGSPDPAALARLREDGEIGERIHKQQQAGGDVYLTVQEMGGPALMRLRAPLRAPTFFAGCPQPEREGNVLLRLLVPETGIPNEDGSFGRMSVQLAGGTLAGTPAAACLTERIAAVLTAHELPRPVGGHLRFESWTWRPGEPPRLATPPLL